MAKDVRTITIVNRDGDTTQARRVYERKKKRKTSPGLGKLAERMERRLLNTERTWTDEMLRLHTKSTRKKKDGWLVDGVANLVKADRKAYKRLRKGFGAFLPRL